MSVLIYLSVNLLRSFLTINAVLENVFSVDTDVTGVDEKSLVIILKFRNAKTHLYQSFIFVHSRLRLRLTISEKHVENILFYR